MPMLGAAAFMHARGVYFPLMTFLFLGLPPRAPNRDVPLEPNWLWLTLSVCSMFGSRSVGTGMPSLEIPWCWPLITHHGGTEQAEDAIELETPNPSGC